MKIPRRGSVFETVDALLENKSLTMIGEIILPIRHCLLSKEDTLPENIKKIYSHPQALAQCRKYILEKMPNSETIEVASTTMGCQEALKKENSACISNKICSEIYGLKMIDENIQDENTNATKFIIIAKRKADLTKNAKTSIVLGTENKPGELYKVLGLFNVFNINLTKIESRPAKTKLGEYIFLIDFIGHKDEEHIKVLIQQIKKMASYIRILGSYPSAE